MQLYWPYITRATHVHFLVRVFTRITKLLQDKIDWSVVRSTVKAYRASLVAFNMSFHTMIRKPDRCLTNTHTMLLNLNLCFCYNKKIAVIKLLYFQRTLFMLFYMKGKYIDDDLIMFTSTGYLYNYYGSWNRKQICYLHALGRGILAYSDIS